MNSNERLRKARIRAGYDTATDAARAHGWVVQTYLGHENGNDGVSKGAIEKYARAFRVDPGWLLTGKNPFKTIPLLGYVGAGAEVFIMDDHAKGPGLDEIEAPPGASPSSVAVRVRGDSMYPRYDDGDVLIYSEQRQPGDILGRECIVKLHDGRLLVKSLTPNGNGLFALHSHNAPPILDVAVEWIAEIEWVRRG